MGLLDPIFAANGTDANVDYQSTLARALQERLNGTDYSPVASPWQGAAHLAQALAGKIDERRANTAAQNSVKQITDLLGQPQMAAQPVGSTTPAVPLPAGATPASAAPSAGQDAIRAQAGITGTQPSTAMPQGYWERLTKIESGNDPNNVTGSNVGLAQFAPSDMKTYGLDGADPRDPAVARTATEREAVANTAAFRTKFGRDPSPGELYLMHQQGQAGALALMGNPDTPAAAAIRKFYPSDAIAQKAIAGNLGDPNAPAGQFVQNWVNKFEGVKTPSAPATQSQMLSTALTRPQAATAPTSGVNPKLLALALSPSSPPQVAQMASMLLQTQMAPKYDFVTRPDGSVVAVNKLDPTQSVIAQGPMRQPTWGVISETPDGAKLYGWINPLDQSVVPGPRPGGLMPPPNPATEPSQANPQPPAQTLAAPVQPSALAPTGALPPVTKVPLGPVQPAPVTPGNAPAAAPQTQPAPVTLQQTPDYQHAGELTPERLKMLRSPTPSAQPSPVQAQPIAPAPATNMAPAPAAPAVEPGPAKPTAEAKPQEPQAVTLPRMPGEDYLDSLKADPQWGPYTAQARAILRGDAPVPVGNAATKPVDQAIMRLVYAADPNFNSSVAASRGATIKDFQNGDNPVSSGGQIVAANTALGHLEELAKASEQLGKLQFGSSLLNTAKEAVMPSSSEYGQALTAFHAAREPLVGELAKFYSGTAGTEGERNALKVALDETASPEARRSAIGVFARDLEAKAQELQRKWHQSMGPGAQDYPILGPSAQRSLQYITGLTRPATSLEGALKPDANGWIALPNGVKIKQVN